MEKTDCPCGFGKNIPETNPICPVCQTDLSILFLINNLSIIYNKRGRTYIDKSNYPEALKNLKISYALDPDNKELKKLIEKTEDQNK